MTSTTTSLLPVLLAEVEAVRVERLSPSFVRVELAGPALAELGGGTPSYDQRIKLVLPHGEGPHPDGPDGPLPSIDGADESWFSTWLDQPVEQRGHLRTYTVREVLGQGIDTRVVVDFVLHGPDTGGHPGPGSSWAGRAAVGDRLMLMGPRRGVPYGGIEFDPGTAGRLLLVGDETAVPAICAILAQLPSYARGAAFLEVPLTGDVVEVHHPRGVQVVWLPRDGAALGSRLAPAVLEHLGAPRAPVLAEHDVDPDLWETPHYSSSGEDVDQPVVRVGHETDDLYAWIAGESSVVTGLRRVLVNDLEVDRRQVAFMGYWRLGVAMRS